MKEDRRERNIGFVDELTWSNMLSEIQDFYAGIFTQASRNLLRVRFAYSIAYPCVGDVDITFILMLCWCYQMIRWFSYNVRYAIGIFNNVGNTEGRCIEIFRR